MLPDFPPCPPLQSPLRLAVAADISRLASLSVLGFKDSEIFLYERPRYSEFPLDAVASFANLYRGQLLDPRVVVLAVDDWCRPDEDRCRSVADGESHRRVVVGVASWYFPEGSPRTGQFVVPNVGPLWDSPDRDLCLRRLALVTRCNEAAEQKYFGGMVVCDKLVVHPSYRNRGHATAMLRWGQKLCDADAVDQGVIPSHIGKPLYRELGYKVIAEIGIPDDGEVKGFSQEVVVYRAKPDTKEE